MKQYYRFLLVILLSTVTLLPSSVRPVQAAPENFIESLPPVVEQGRSVTFRGKLLKAVKLSQVTMRYKISNSSDVCTIENIVQPYLRDNPASETAQIGDVIEYKQDLDPIQNVDLSLYWDWKYEGDDGTVVTIGYRDVVKDPRVNWYLTTSKTTNIRLYVSYNNQVVADEMMAAIEDRFVLLANSGYVRLKKDFFVRPGNDPRKMYIDISGGILPLDIFIYESSEVYANEGDTNGISMGISSREWKTNEQIRADLLRKVTTHALNVQKASCRPSPDWFVQGFTTHVETMLFPGKYQNTDVEEYLLHVRHYGVLDLDDTAKDKTELPLYRVQGQLIVEYLRETYGTEKLENTWKYFALNRKIRGVRGAQNSTSLIPTHAPFEQDFETIYGFPYTNLGQAYTEYLNQRFPAEPTIPAYGKPATQPIEEPVEQEWYALLSPLYLRVAVDAKNITLSMNTYFGVGIVLVILGIVIIVIARSRRSNTNS